MWSKQNEAFTWWLVNGMKGKGEEARTSWERGSREGAAEQQFLLLLSQIWSPLLSLLSFNLQPNSRFHYQDNASYYLFIARNIMMDVFQSAPALIRSAQTLAQSVSTLLIITHDCCDLVPMPRQLELRLSTINYREMGWVKEIERKEKGVEKDVTEDVRSKEGRKGKNEGECETKTTAGRKQIFPAFTNMFGFST